MDTRLKAELEDCINKWSEKHCEDPSWPDAWWYEDLGVDMATAAEIVFDANVKGQEFAENER